MKTRKLIIALIVTLAASSAYACTAFFDRDYVSGMSRVCIYKHLGSDYAMTIKSYEICPITIEVDH